LFNNHCIFFGGSKSFYRGQFNRSIIRIPEVSNALRTAQELIDLACSEHPSVDLFSHLHFWDEQTESDLYITELLCNIMQWGLYQRFKKTSPLPPKFIVGPAGHSSINNLVAGKISFEELVLQSPFLQNWLKSRVTENDTQLRVISPNPDPNQYDLLQLENESYIILNQNSDDPYQFLSQLNLDFRVQNFVLIGPDATPFAESLADRKIFDFQIQASTSFDPMLSAFWQYSA